MEVHLICSRKTLMEEIDQMREMVRIIQDSGNIIKHEWIERAYNRYKSNVPYANWVAIYQQSVETIARTDVVIAECSHENFAIGYMVALAIQHRKPILLLRHEGVDDNVFATGVEDGWVVRKKYNEHTVRTIIEDFLNVNNVQSKDMRFNFFIDRKIYNYLRWASYKTGKTKSEILRNLVENEIDKKGTLDS